MIGDLDRMPDEARRRLEKCMADTAHCSGLTLILALSYSARWELVRAARLMAADARSGKISPSDIDEHTMASYLSTAGIPDPDLLIRTGGDKRVSNFLLWQIAYSELSVTDTYWPDYSADDFYRAIIDYQRRERRFGLTSEQLK